MSSLTLSPATHEDAARIAAIHLAAFDVNPLLHAQFPTPQDLANLQEFLAEDTIEELSDPMKAVLVVKTREGKIISFAKWTLPEAGDQVLHEDTAWPKGCVRELLDEYYMKAEGVKRSVIGGEKCYRLAVLATDPEYEHRGAASMLLQWGIDLSTKEGIPAYLESTVEAAPLYKRHGFKPEGSFTMVFTLKGKTDRVVEYSETCFVLRPTRGTR